jgi:hypothetical protein
MGLGPDRSRGAWLRQHESGRREKVTEDQSMQSTEDGVRNPRVKLNQVPVEKGFQFVKKEVVALTHLVSIHSIETGQISTRRAHTPWGD